jgi:hypothetical protein
MKKDIYMDFYTNMLRGRSVQSDDFFSNETIALANAQSNLYDGHRMQSREEERVITDEAFHLLLFWVRSGELDPEVFERVMSILVTYSHKIKRPIDQYSIPGMIELMSLIDFKDHVIYSTIELYISAPDLLKNRFQQEH